MGSSVKHRLKLALFGILALAVVCAVCLTAAMFLHGRNQEEAAAVPSPLAAYDKERALFEKDLSMTPLEIQDDIVILPDRILKRYHYSREDIEITADAFNQAYSVVPEGVNKHFMAVPLRISMEPAFKDYTDDMESAIDELYSLIDGVVKYDVYSALREQTGKYNYYRYDKRWTALGAYHAAQLFLAQQGISAIPLDKYELYWAITFSGDLKGISKQAIEDDLFMYFLLPGGVNWQKVTLRTSSGESITTESPAVALSRRSDFIIIGSRISHSILYGDAKNNRALLVVGDSFSRFLPTWFTPYYECVIWVNTEWYDGGPEEFLSLFEEYPISDVIMLEGIPDWGASTGNKRLVRFTTGG